MGKSEQIPRREYMEEFKTEAVRLAISVGGNAAAKRLGIPQSTMTNWVRRRKTALPSTEQATQAPTRRPISELEAENSRLRRELASVKIDLEIVKKAAAYFVRESR